MTASATAPRSRFTAARLAAALWGAMIVAGIVIGAVGPASWRDSIAHDGPGCPFLRATGLPCPFCGMTRATMAMASGDFGGALHFHPLAPLVLFGNLFLVGVVVAGRADALLQGKRPYVLLGSIIAIWILRFLL
ncbi:MAG TPA: DUF2752 domain-containing protein [Kofleriaceae bacterium]|nr:DUF2752 domain-containing protein [Kofleriaceae bacterium]